MKLFVVKLGDCEEILWGVLNEAVVRAEDAEQAKALLADSWHASKASREVWASRLLASEINPDGPAGIISGTVES